jgi:hypothetical protein
MVACVVKVVLLPDTEWEAERIADIMFALLRKYEAQGFCGVSYLFEYETGEYMGISYWNATKAYVESVLPHFIPLLREMVKHSWQWEPSVEMYDVYEPRIICVE